METYHKINTVFKRNPENMKELIFGDYSEPAFEYLANNEWTFTEKVDGTNIRVIYEPENDFTFKGKTDKAEMYPGMQEKLEEIFYPLRSKFKEFFTNDICLYGEGYGPKIQKGGKYRKDVSFVLFDIKIGNWWLTRAAVEYVAEIMNLDIVPIIGKGTLFDAIQMTKDGFKSQWGDFIAEGIIAKPSVDLFSRSGKRIITKIKYKDFRNV